jgi:formylglycine-generating enzyme required for sulfatase activity
MMPSEDRSPLVQLIMRLKRQQIDWDGENIADLLWLSRYMEVTEQSAPLASEPETSRIRTEILDGGDLPPSSPPARDLSLSVPGGSRTQLQPSQPQPSASGMPFQTPTAPALRKTLSLGRSLRPLMRKVDSYTRTVLNEEATAEQTAERKFCITVVKPEQERWLEVALVIEHTASSFIWQETIQEFKRLLEHQGAFRSVSVWYLQVSSASARATGAKKVGAKKTGTEPAAKGDPVKLLAHRPGSRQQPTRNLKELVDPAGRRLIWVVSDCISSAWQQGIIQSECLELWAKHGPVAIMQLLPGNLWGRTVLRSGVAVKLSGLTPGAANQALGLHDIPVWIESRMDYGLKLPIVTLEPESLGLWARMVAGFGEHRVPGIWFDEGWQQGQQEEPVPPILSEAEPLVHRFNTTASLMARQLATYMAIGPIQLPIIYLIQATMLPDSTPLHVAEVFMSGLIQRGEGAEFRTGTPDDSGRTYEFVPGVRECLIDLADRPGAERLLDAMSQYIGGKIGQSIYSFPALLTLEKQAGATAGADLMQFARLTKQSVQRLGGEYAAFVQALEDAPPPPERIVFPPLKTLEFTIVQLVYEVDEPGRSPNGLEPFEFTVATLQARPADAQPRRKGTKQSSKQPPAPEWVIQRQQQQAWRLIEPLVDELMLEMVAIPGGTFLMGSPEHEPERYNDESPQHEVTVADFLMGRYPVTQAQWRAVAGMPEVSGDLDADPSDYKGDNRPVENVSWHEATEFCARLSQHTGRSYRLPSEAEWEYACRAGTTTPFSFGEMVIPDLANYDWDKAYNKSNVTQEKEFQGTTPVDQFGIANAFGLCDLHGNVWEWCQDHWHDNYTGAPVDGTAWVDPEALEDASRVLRGGSWIADPRNCRSATRSDVDAGDRDDCNGFRVVCVAPRTL